MKDTLCLIILGDIYLSREVPSMARRLYIDVCLIIVHELDVNDFELSYYLNELIYCIELLCSNALYESASFVRFSGG